MEQGCPAQSFATRDSRVGSPSAANMGARACSLARRLRKGDMFLDVFHLLGPTAVVHAEGLEVAIAGDLVEAGLGEPKQCAVLGLLQPEFDECRSLFRVVFLGIDGIRMPGKGKE